MPDAVKFALADGTAVTVAPAARAGTGPAALGERLETAEKTLHQALTPVTVAAAEIMDRFRELSHGPDEVEIEFGVTLDGKLGGILASVNSGAHLDIRLRWNASDTTPTA